MNLISKALTRALSSSLHHSKFPNQKWLVSHQSRLYAAKAKAGRNKSTVKEPVKAPETEPVQPTMIEFQTETVNSVNLIGVVDQNVQIDSRSDGKIWAGTVLSHRSASKASNFWVPIIFQGDLANTAATHIKKDDCIHISGYLFTDPPSQDTSLKSLVQVVVQNLSFVEGLEVTDSLPEQEVISTTKKQSVQASSKKIEVIDEETSNPWKRLLENPKEWLDYRGNKANGLAKPKHPDFKSKDGLSLWINNAPGWVLQNLQGLEFGVITPKGKPKLLTREESWNDLVQNPDKWLDQRSEKTNTKAPDFKHKETGEALWMTSSPTWVLSKLPPLKKIHEQPIMANTISQPTPKQLKREESWKALVQNPDKWYDNRSNKKNPKAPDFKHKETNEALWMDSAPASVLSELPPPNQEQTLMANTSSQPIQKQQKGEESWKDLVQNPDKWYDNRSNKKNPKAPDFKHKETGEALWMNRAPTSVLSELPPPKAQEQPLMTNTTSQPMQNKCKREESWKDVVQNPGKWYDNRSNKKNPKAPDFKHKETGEALWMNSAPPSVLSELPPLMNQEQPNTPSQPMQKQRKEEECWVDLVENPDKWLDNRSGKRSAKSPDFKHKETGEALWMSGSPVWALSKLPPIKNNQEMQIPVYD